MRSLPMAPLDERGDLIYKIKSRPAAGSGSRCLASGSRLRLSLRFASPVARLLRRQRGVPPVGRASTRYRRRAGARPTEGLSPCDEGRPGWAAAGKPGSAGGRPPQPVSPVGEPRSAASGPAGPWSTTGWRCHCGAAGPADRCREPGTCGPARWPRRGRPCRAAATARAITVRASR